ncbi:hypothetical protein [Duganella qianjiadongensis]|uniref:Uncharacterized protein n=1 Tax=Duganella qianjiadongensis TaxID=2692176 RepID=A0ABW9VP01_9BURK|nr:hypothetical protein [Duganella qianjiadongensis]MYM40148.1 hypothetical protein [Duganella qianjiadongensis]
MKDGINVSESGDLFIVRNEKLHCEDGPAIIWSDGSYEWYLNGLKHRTDGPAVERSDGTKFWYLNNKLHREDGPAIVWADGHRYWYLNGAEIKKREFDKYLEKIDRNNNQQSIFASKQFSKIGKM